MPAGMNNETLLLRQIDRQSDIISLLQKENACFRQIIQTYLLGNVAATQSELALVKSLTEESFSNVSFVGKSEGRNGINSFHRDSDEGINGTNSFQRSSNDGINIKNSFQRNSGDGINEEFITVLAVRLRAFMTNAMQLTLENTALILCHLQSDPATPLVKLRKLTGLSEDGMAKRIMALKKAGLIVRQSAPLRFVLTEKAKALL